MHRKVFQMWSRHLFFSTPQPGFSNARYLPQDWKVWSRWGLMPRLMLRLIAASSLSSWGGEIGPGMGQESEGWPPFPTRPGFWGCGHWKWRFVVAQALCKEAMWKLWQRLDSQQFEAHCIVRAVLCNGGTKDTLQSKTWGGPNYRQLPRLKLFVAATSIKSCLISVDGAFICICVPFVLGRWQACSAKCSAKYRVPAEHDSHGRPQMRHFCKAGPLGPSVDIWHPIPPKVTPSDGFFKPLWGVTFAGWNALFLPGCRGKGNAGGLQESDVEGHLIGGFLNRDTPDHPSH